VEAYEVGEDGAGENEQCGPDELPAGDGGQDEDDDDGTDPEGN